MKTVIEVRRSNESTSARRSGSDGRFADVDFEDAALLLKRESSLALHRATSIGDQPMAANPDEPRSTPATKWATVERFALVLGVVVFPVLAIALGIAVTILANALR